MKTKFRFLAVLLITLVIAAAFTSCESLLGSVCQHRDEDDNSLCDKCGKDYEDGRDVEGNPVCQHRDADDNTLCDKCGESYEDGRDKEDETPCQHKDTDGNSLCDDCGVRFSTGTNVPDGHIHSFSDWVRNSSDDDIPCDERLFSRVCSGCNGIEWKYGSYEDHILTTVTVEPTCKEAGYDKISCSRCNFTKKENYNYNLAHTYSGYVFDKSSHWQRCTVCGEESNLSAHRNGTDGYCTVCNNTPTDGIEYAVSEDGTYAEVMEYKGSDMVVVIAAEYKGKPVKVISDDAFRFSWITDVIIPDTVTDIGEYAFGGCDPLERVIFSESLKTIGSQAFYDCCNLKSPELPDSLVSIGSYAFRECSEITSVLIPEGVTEIGDKAFADCDELTTVTIPDSICSVGNDICANSDNVEYFVSDGCLYLGNEYEPTLVLIKPEDKYESEYHISGSTKVIADYAFSECARLTAIEIPNSVTFAGNGTFYQCKLLEEIVFPENTTVIGYAMFNFCSALESIVIPDGVTLIDFSAFARCENLKTVVLPSSVTEIQDNAFADCDNLESVYYKGINGDFGEVEIGDFNSDLTIYANFYFYSASDPGYSGFHWHYDNDGNIVLW